MQDICIFKRVEKKYPLDKEKKDMLLSLISHRLEPDPHGKNTICSLYIDTPDRVIIRNSLDARVYKEKLRIRSYGIPQKDTPVFLEIKKKYKGVVYKRRVKAPLEQVYRYLETGEKPVEGQIMSEIDYALKFYKNAAPSMLILYEREAYFSAEDEGLRLTFDKNIRYRETETEMEKGDFGTAITEKDQYILEIKTNGGMPLWLSKALNECGIFPSRFSKYGTAFIRTLTESAKAN